MGGLRELFGFDPTIGDLIASSLRDEPDAWSEEYGIYRNRRHGWELRVHSMPSARVLLSASIPLTGREERAVKAAIYARGDILRERARASALEHYRETEVANG